VKTTLSEREGNTVKLAVEVSSEELEQAFNKNLRELAREARIPGFRPGKAPAAMIRQRMGDEAILANTIEESMSAWFAEAITELGLDPVERPEIELGEETLELGKSLGFTATVIVMPEVVLGEYKGVEAPKEPVEVEDKEVDAQMDRLRNEFAELRPVTGRSVKKKDFVTVDLRGSLEGDSVDGLDADDFVFEVGGGRVFPEIDEQIVGMEPGSERTFPLTLPEGVGPPGAEGKTLDLTIALKEIKEKVLPRLSDRWASEVSEFKTLLELRLDIRRKLEAGKTYASDQRFRSLAVKAVTDNATLDLPDVVVREQAEELVDDFKRSLESQGTTLEAYVEASGTTVEQMIEDLEPQAANNVKTGLVLDAVAKAEGIEASDEDISAAVARMAAAGRVDAKSFEAKLRKSGRIEPVRWQIVREKAADFIMANAVGVAPTPSDDSVEADAQGSSPEAATAESASAPAEPEVVEAASTVEETAAEAPSAELAEAAPAADTPAEGT
jgi:trigger factor